MPTVKETHGWARSGKCPQCSDGGAITGGRCIMCGWVSEYRMERIHHHANMINRAYEEKIKLGLLEYFTREELLRDSMNALY